MKLENQLCTLGQAKRLKELGISINNSLFVFIDNKAIGKLEGIKFASETHSKKHFKEIKDTHWIKFYSAFTVAELGAMLGMLARNTSSLTEDGNEAIDRADDLIHLLEINELCVDNCNERLKN